jgi:hypothetical protein
MALKFDILKLKKNENYNGYYLKARLNGFIGEYLIFTDAKMSYDDWISDEDLRFSVLDGFDCGFNGELPYLKVEGMNFASRTREGEIEGALIKFIKEECI